MNCPHCLVEFHAHVTPIYLGTDAEGVWSIDKYTCPNPKCVKDIYYLLKDGVYQNGQTRQWHNRNAYDKISLIRPKGVNRSPLSLDVPQQFADDYKEACLVLSDSPKASAALSRRCLQLLLRERAGIKKGDLFNEIQEVIDGGKLPSHIEESIDAIRNTGNFAAHPIKSKSTGEIVAVEPGEAEWNLEVLEMLFDFYFVQPAKIKVRRDLLNQKLQDAGKPAMK